MTVDSEYLRQLFLTCLEADYKHTDGNGSYATLRDGELLYLFFEKSNGGADWINNLSYRAANRGRLGERWFCHEGFLRVFNDILPEIEYEIADRTVRKIVTVGYSHGAALALLCQEHIWYTRPDVSDDCYAYGFGCPRVIFGTVPREGERWRNFYIVRNIDDLVTHLPPKALGYRHVGRLLEIGRAGKYTAIDAHREENYLLELQIARDAVK